MGNDAAGRAGELLAAMSLEEKLAQLSAYMFFDTFWHKHDSVSEHERIDFIHAIPMEEMIPAEGLGFFSTQLRDLPPRMAAEQANKDQAYIRENTRHGVPAIIQDEGVHGLIGHGATCYPSALGMAASWDVELFEQVARAIGREARARGVRQLLSPTLNLGLDVRNGRTEETYGEDPLLAARMAVAFVRGVQSNGVVCTPKHFVANFEGDGGRDSWAVHFSERRLRELFFVPFETCVREARPLSLMTAYNTLDGTPCTSSRWLLEDVLRREWGFEGYVVTDYHSLVHIWELHKVAASKKEAAALALEAGVDVEFPRFDCYGAPLREAIDEGTVPIEWVDRAVERILRVKFKIGLFDDPIVDPDEAERVTNCAEHRDLARQMARESIVLLKNEGNVLPLGVGVRSIAVIGPNADSIEMGDYAWDLYTKDHVVTPLEGLKKLLPPEVTLRHAKGCGLADGTDDELREAVKAASASDVAVLFLGSSVKLAGEARDRTSLNLPGRQEELIRAVAATGKPVVVVLITGSVHTIAGWDEKAHAILHAWYAGEEGGTALAEILLGRTNPSGKLPISIPRTIGQCPVYHHQKPSGRGNVYTKLGQDGGVHYPFGHGLSYTTWDYSDLTVEPAEWPDGETLRVSLTLRNAGNVDGTEVVQLYAHDRVACVARPMMELKAFRRVSAAPGESVQVEFELSRETMAFIGREMERVIEPGPIEVMVGSSCVDIRLRGEVELI